MALALFFLALMLKSRPLRLSLSLVLIIIPSSKLLPIILNVQQKIREGKSHCIR